MAGQNLREAIEKMSENDVKDTLYRLFCED